MSGELEDEHWRLCSTTVGRGVAGELEAGDFKPKALAAAVMPPRQRRIYTRT